MGIGWLIRLVLNPGQSLSLKDFSLAQGFIVWVDNTMVENLNYILHTLQTLKLPIIIYDEIYEVDSGVIKKRKDVNSYIHYFNIPDFLAGYSIGRMLLEAGHKKAAFFSYSLPNEVGTLPTWSAKRYEGLKRAFFDAGLLKPETVRLFTVSSTERSINFLLDEDNSDARTMQNQSDLLAKCLNPFLNENIDPLIRGHIVNNINEIQFHHFFGRWAFFDEIRKALSDNSISAWVASEDYVMVYAMLPFLKRHQIKIPEQVSLVSFNNTIEAFVNSITSYDFNMHGIVARFVDIILNRTKPDPSMFDDVGGFITFRESMRV